MRLCGPGRALRVEGERKKDVVIIRLPRGQGALVSKGLVVRCDLLRVLEEVDREGAPRRDVIYAYIDGSRAYASRFLSREGAAWMTSVVPTHAARKRSNVQWQTIEEEKRRPSRTGMCAQHELE